MAQAKAKAPIADAAASFTVDEVEIAYLAKRHRISPAIVREIIRRTGSHERGAIEREIEKGKARR
jgi:Mor family transcriptional regulator